MKKFLITLSGILSLNSIQAQADPEIYRLSFPSTKSYEQGKPLLSADGKELYFVSSYFETEAQFVTQNIWKTVWNNYQTPLKPELVAGLSNNDNNAVIGFDAKTGEAFLLGTYSKKETLKKGVSVSQFNTGAWTKPAELKVKSLFIKGDQYDFFKPTNARVLFLALPDKDNVLSLYVSAQDEEGKWLKPELISALSNKETSEISPFYDEAEGYLYFSSNRSGGLGDMDIYRAKKLDDTWLNWSAPERLPAPINSASFDAYFSTYGEKGAFMVSARQDSLSNIYFVKMDTKTDLQEPVKSDELASMDASEEGIFYYDGLPKEGARLQLLDENGNVVEETITGENGEFKFTKLDPNKDYSIRMLTEDGTFDPNMASIKPFKYSGLKPITSEMKQDGMSDNELVVGVFKYEGLPKEGIEVVLLDENGNIVSTTMTDAGGYYEFKNLPPNKVYIVKYMDEDGSFDPNAMEVYPIAAKPAPVAKVDKPAEPAKVTPAPPAPAKPTVAPTKKEAPKAQPAAADKAEMGLIVHYDFNLLNPNPEEWEKVKKQLAGLDKGIRIKVEGHSDNIGSEEANLTVSLMRAELIKKFLTELGFDPELISVDSFSYHQPVESNDTPTGRSRNRRVEIKVQ